MESKDAYDIALRISDLYIKSLQFFIAICTLFGGWILVKGLPDELWARGLVALIFGGSTFAILLGQLGLLSRIDAALSLSKTLSNAGSDPKIAPLFALQGRKARIETALGMGVVIVATVALIFMTDVSKESSASETQVHKISH